MIKGSEILKEFERKSDREHKWMIVLVACCSPVFGALTFLIVFRLLDSYGDRMWCLPAGGVITLIIVQVFYKLFVAK